MTIYETIKNELREAMKARNTVKVTTLRGLLSAFTNELVAQKKKPDAEVDDELALQVITRAVKQRKDSIEQFKKGSRDDLASNEEAEMKILQTFLPEQMSREEIEGIARTKKEELGITDKSGSGQLMGALMKELKGKASGEDVKAVVDSLLE